MDLITTADVLGICSSNNRPSAFSCSGTDLINFYLCVVSQTAGTYSTVSPRKLTKARYMQFSLGELQCTEQGVFFLLWMFMLFHIKPNWKSKTITQSRCMIFLCLHMARSNCFWPSSSMSSLMVLFFFFFVVKWELNRAYKHQLERCWFGHNFFTSQLIQQINAAEKNMSPGVIVGTFPS